MRKSRTALLFASCLSLSGLFASCSKKSPEPEVGKGILYQTQLQSFWVGVGKAYRTFENNPEPETKEEGKLYGYVFNVNVSSDSGKTYSSWLSGKWTRDEQLTTLTLNAAWEEGEDSTILTDATSGQDKTYTAKKGKFTIGVKLPSAGTVDFTLDPVKDKVADDVTPLPPSECVDHVDADKEGKCDKCGKDRPKKDNTNDSTKQEVTVRATLTASASDGKKAKIDLKIDLKSDKTWLLSVSYYEGGDFTETASGTWKRDTSYNIVLTVTTDTANVLANDSYTLNVDYMTQKYSGTIELDIPQIGKITFDFSQDENTDKPATKVVSTLTATASGKTAKIELLEDNTWNLSVKYWDGGEFTPTASGTWKRSTTDYKITLTVTKDDADVLANDTYILDINYETRDYSAQITLNLPAQAGGAATFDFTTASAEAAHYSVTYNLNYDGASTLEKGETSTFDAGEHKKKEYIKTAPETPTREGYKFAGWYTEQNPVLTNGASASEYLFGQKLSAYNSAPDTIKNDVREISADTTLYARWVQCKEISNATELKERENDLHGWYKLTDDITLTEEWNPIGGYYANYEFYENNWWVYSFHGTLDGNNHKVKGLSLKTLDFADDAVSAKEGKKSGTTAFFASAVNCTAKDITFEQSKVAIKDYSLDTHVYVSVLAAFIQGGDTLFENCTVKDSSIKVSYKDSWYISVAGLFSGHWGGNAKNCNVLNTTIDVNSEYTKVTGEGRTYEALYVGGLVGEGYAWLDSCDSKADITLTLNDKRTQETVPRNIYFGGARASSTYLNKVTYEGNITLDHTKAVGEENVYRGGISGYQRYGYINNCYAKASRSANNKNTAAVEHQSFTGGGILGAFDTRYGLWGTAYFFIPNGCRVSNSLDNSSLTTTGTPTFQNQLSRVDFVSSDAIVDAYNQSFNVDRNNFKRADGSYNYFGAFNCVKIDANKTAGTDVDGNVTVLTESAAYGNALKSTLGSQWTYADGKLPVPTKG